MAGMFLEYLIVGVYGLFLLLFFGALDIPESMTVSNAALYAAIAYIAGLLVDTPAKAISDFLSERILGSDVAERLGWKREKLSSDEKSLVFSKIYANPQLASAYSARRSRIRICRGCLLVTAAMLVITITQVLTAFGLVLLAIWLFLSVIRYEFLLWKFLKSVLNIQVDVT